MTVLRSFYIRLSLVFLALIVLLAVIQGQVGSNVFDRQRAEINQRANAMLAADMAAEIEPYVGEDGVAAREALGSAIHYMMVLNPLIEIYLISDTGTVEAYFADTPAEVQMERIDLEPVRAFVSGEGDFPIFGDDPRRPGEPTTFSAAPMPTLYGGTGYMYVVLRSSLYDSAQAEIEDEFFRTAFRDSLLLSMPLVALLGLLVFFLLTLRLRRLTAAVRAFGAGDYDARAQISSADEVGELAESFNEMARRIASGVETLERVERERRDLVANISHDLRTPLSAIRGYVETVLHKDEELPAADRRSYLRIALSSSEALGRLVDDLFELSRLEHDGNVVEREVFPLAELCHDVVMQSALAAEERGITVTMDAPPELFPVEADISLIERTLTNLLENALRHTPAGSTVRVALSGEPPVDGVRESPGPGTGPSPGPSAGPGAGPSPGPANEEGAITDAAAERESASPSWVEVTVADDGPGLTGEERERVFLRRYTGAGRGESGRVGLGLAIARRIVELHGGTIGVRSGAEGGSVFFFTLPRYRKETDL